MVANISIHLLVNIHHYESIVNTVVTPSLAGALPQSPPKSAANPMYSPWQSNLHAAICEKAKCWLSHLGTLSWLSMSAEHGRGGKYLRKLAIQDSM